MAAEKDTLDLVPALPVPDHLVGEVQSKLAFVDPAIVRAEVSPTSIRLVLKQPLGGPDDPLRLALDEKVQRVINSMVKGSFKPKVQVLEDQFDRPVPFCEDPMSALEARGELNREATGIYSLGPLLTRLIEYFEGHFLRLAASFDAQPYRFPTLIPASYLEKVGYFRSFPQMLTFATHLREDLDVIDHFASHAACTEHGLNTSLDSFSPVQAMLSPAVCYHLYFALAGQALPAEGLAATAVGNCFRYESINLNSLERLWNFTMREVIFVGSKDFVLENREIARQRMAPVLEEVGLAYRVESANDPFFIGDFRKQVAFQSAFQLKFEIRARLPFRGTPRGAGEPGSLAVGSYNHHQDFFGRSLNITLPDGSPAHTGCVAFGLERMAFAFLSQYGLDPSGWPEAVRKAVYG